MHDSEKWLEIVPPNAQGTPLELPLLWMTVNISDFFFFFQEIETKKLNFSNLWAHEHNLNPNHVDLQQRQTNRRKINHLDETSAFSARQQKKKH